MRQESRHIVITGASSGIGRAIAIRLASEGARVSLLARRPAALEETAVLVLDAAPDSAAFLVPCDVTNRASLDHAFAAAVRSNGPVHAVVTAAGIGGPNAAGVDSSDPSDRFDTIVATNLTGTYLSLRAAQRHLAPGPGPRQMVLISSILGRFGVPGYTAYCASKAALLGLTRAMALELAPQNVLVNAICPGWVDTGMAWEGIDGMAKGMGITRDEAHAIAMSAVRSGGWGSRRRLRGSCPGCSRRTLPA